AEARELLLVESLFRLDLDELAQRERRLGAVALRERRLHERVERVDEVTPLANALVDAGEPLEREDVARAAREDPLQQRRRLLLVAPREQHVDAAVDDRERAVVLVLLDVPAPDLEQVVVTRVV